MKSGNKKNNKNASNKNADEVVKSDDVIEFSTIKRMMYALDRFLTKRFMFVLAICFAVFSMSMIGLAFADPTFGFAASPDGAPIEPRGGDLTIQVLLWSLVAVSVFVALLATVCVLRKKRKDKVQPK